MKPQAIRPAHFPWLDYSRYSFPLGLDIGDGALLSGSSAAQYDPVLDRIVVCGDMNEQTRTVYAKIEAVLEAGGYTCRDVVHIVEYVTKEAVGAYEEAASVRAEVFGDSQPAVSTVVVDALLHRDAMIEIEASAGTADDSGGRATKDGVVYLPTMTPTINGRLVGEGDIGEQVRQIFSNARRALEEVGLTMRNVVKTIEMISPAGVPDYRMAENIRREHLDPVYPSAVSIVQERVARNSEILVSYDFIASRHVPVVVDPGWERYEKLTCSPAVRAGSVLFMSGQTALDPATGRPMHAYDITAQAEYAYRNVLQLLDVAGLTPENLVQTIEYVTPSGLPRYREIADVRRGLLPEPYPASTGTVCHSLRRSELEIEVDPVALYFE